LGDYLNFGAGIWAPQYLLAGWQTGLGQSCESSQLAQNSNLCLQSLMVSPLVCAEGREQEEAARREKARLWEMDEDEYDALTEEQKAEFNNKIREVQRERRKRSVSLPWVNPQDSVPEGFPCSGELG